MQDHPSRSESDALRSVLQRLGVETGELAVAADRLQHLFGKLLADPQPRPVSALQDAQALDALVQRLEGVTTYLAALSEGRLEHLSADSARAASKLPLTRQRRRLAPETTQGHPELVAGDCDLF